MKYIVGYLKNMHSYDEFVEIKGFNDWEDAFAFYLSIYLQYQEFVRIKDNVNKEWAWLKYTRENM